MDIMSIMEKVASKYEWEWANEYGEPGYGNVNTKVIVFQNGSGPDLYKYPHIEAACREAGIEFESYDEWWIDHDNNAKAYRTQADGYGWQSSIQFNEDISDYLTPDDDLNEWVEWAIGGEGGTRALSRQRCTVAELEELGFEEFPEDDHEYQNGWHPGQTDDPNAIYAAIREVKPESDVLFYIHETSQFYISFKAFTRPTKHTISSGSFSHDTQVSDAMDYLQLNHVESYTLIKRLYPETFKWDGAWLDTEAMDVDQDFSSWVADAIENTGHIEWEDGEPYAIVS